MNLELCSPGAAARLLVFLDYDGTLVRLRTRPELARLSLSRQGVLAKLGRTAIVGIVTGRELSEARRLVRLRSLAYIGNHGFEIAFKGRTWTHPEAERRRIDLRAAVRRIRLRTADFPGVIVENKGLTASVHYRLFASKSISRLEAIVVEEIEAMAGVLKITRGKKVFEIRPDIDWNKGQGILEFMSWIDAADGRCAVYIGDDSTDEDAFLALKGNGITIVVGGDGKSAADFRVRGVREVWAILKMLTDLSRPGGE